VSVGTNRRCSDAEADGRPDLSLLDADREAVEDVVADLLLEAIDRERRDSC
jgi:hypothetical protein